MSEEQKYDRIYVPGVGMIKASSTDPVERVVPTQRETFEAQVLVMTRSYTKKEYPYFSGDALFFPMRETQRVLDKGKYRLELVNSHIANGKPTLIIYEENDEEKGL